MAENRKISDFLYEFERLKNSKVSKLTPNTKQTNSYLVSLNSAVLDRLRKSFTKQDIKSLSL